MEVDEEINILLSSGLILPKNTKTTRKTQTDRHTNTKKLKQQPNKRKNYFKKDR